MLISDAKTIQSAISGKYPWAQEKDRDCILSPDCDGFLCGLYMSHFFGWKIKGYYDGRALFVEKNTDPAKCVFLDMEIWRPDVQSIGQHMLYLNVNRPPQKEVEINFCNCLSPNNIRRFDFNSRFMQKYPLGTIHLLLAILPQNDLLITESGYAPLFYVDGTFKNLLNYPENCLDWLCFLDAENNALNDLFYGKYPFSRLMSVMCDFFKLIQSSSRRRLDKLPLVAKDGTVNIENGAIPKTQKEVTELFLRKMGEMIGWTYQSNYWQWDNYNHYVFDKKSIKPTLGRFKNIIEDNPLSWAIISRESVEYTIDNHGIF